MSRAGIDMPTVVIINPVSGGARDRGGARARVAARVLAAEGVEGQVLVTCGSGDGFRLAKTAARQGAKLVIAWGGDGTINEVGSAIASSDTTLGIIPGGTGNGLARALGISRRPERAFAVALGGTELVMDAGECNGRLFFNVAGVGLDAAVARAFNRCSRRSRLVYGIVVARYLATYDAQAYEIDIGGSLLRTRALLVAVANAPQYGAGAAIAPGARLDNGHLEVVVVEDRPLRQVLWQLPRLFNDSIDRAPGVVTRSTREVRFASDRPILFHVDGEAIEGNRALAIRVMPGVLRVRIPRRA